MSPAQASAWPPESWTEPVAPFHIAGPVYYVGSRELSAYLLVDDAGHILVNVGMEANAPLVLASIRQLGFQPKQVRYILITQAHFDHAGGAAEIQRMTGAEICVGAADAVLIEKGGLNDYVFKDKYPFRAAKKVKRLHHGDRVISGDLSLETLATPGHTPGSCSWLLSFEEQGREKKTILIQASVSVLEGPSLFGNPRYPGVVADFQATFAKLERLQPDIILPDHMVFTHPPDITHADPINPAWFFSPDVLKRQIEKSRSRLQKFIDEQNP